MTRLDDEQIKKVERVLTEAHRSRQEPALGADWTFRVMRDIRRKAAGHGPSTALLGLDRLVWRAAAVATILALIFTGSVWLTTTRNTVELTTLLSNELDATGPLIE
jgi:hypothetical protein